MAWGKGQIVKQALRTAPEDYAAFEAVNLAGRGGVRVLDVGCFDGFNTYLKFAPYAGVARVVGVDPLPEAVAEAATRTAGDARFSFACSTFEDYEPEAGASTWCTFPTCCSTCPTRRPRSPKRAGCSCPAASWW